ncbi:MAG: rubrerythrin family protein [Candidatus Peregrinibacteria bacterium]|nr:rubrerythrin family protein [Candidatus Peregrinibacteria bacterium]
MKKTLENMSKAFIGESQARNRYTIYAKVAKKEGYEQISEVFLQTADQEREHAKWLFRMINEIKGEGMEEIAVEASAPTTFGTTAENLKAAIAGENYEYTSMYPEFAEIAGEESLPEIADRLQAIAVAETHHEERFKKLLEQLEKGTLFKKDHELVWICRKCGYMHSGASAPDECPSCDHPTAYFQVQCETY